MEKPVPEVPCKEEGSKEEGTPGKELLAEGRTPTELPSLESRGWGKALVGKLKMKRICYFEWSSDLIIKGLEGFPSGNEPWEVWLVCVLRKGAYWTHKLRGLRQPTSGPLVRCHCPPAAPSSNGTQGKPKQLLKPRGGQKPLPSQGTPKWWLPNPGWKAAETCGFFLTQSKVKWSKYFPWNLQCSLSRKC